MTRRDLFFGATGIGAIKLAVSPNLTRAFQSADATPVAEVSETDPRASFLPQGIVLADGEPPSPSSPVRGGSIRLVRPGTSVANFNPSAFAQDPQIPLSYLEPLVRPDPSTLRPQPWLAERWAWRASGRQLLFSIREGVTWHDGSPLTATDAAFSFEVYRADTATAVAALFALVETVEATSDREVIVNFVDRDASWLFNAASLPIFSRGQYGDFWDAQPVAGRTLSHYDWSASPPVGTGAWQVSDWDDRIVRFTRYPEYWQRAAWLDALEVAVTESPHQRLDAWVDGDSQIAWPLRARGLPELAERSGTLHAAPAASVMFAAFNFANPLQPAGSLWTDLRVRQAASLAIDRERYANEVFAGFMRWDAAGTVAQPWANDPSLLTPPFNLPAAAALLAEAGWLDYDGDGVLEDLNGWPLRPVAILRQDSRPELSEVMARVARDLAAIGMALTVEVLPPAEFDDRWIARRDYDLIAYAYDLLPGFTDYDLFGSAWDIRTNPVGWNPGGYANTDADAAIADFLTAVSIERQADALRRLQQAVNEDLFGLWLGFPLDLVLVADGIEGFAPDMAWQTARTRNLWYS